MTWAPEVGDTVRLITPTARGAPVKVTRVDKNRTIWGVYLTARYIDPDGVECYSAGGHKVRGRHVSDFEPYPDMTTNQTTDQKEETMTMLYQTKEDKPRFGTKLATNSSGQFVLEMKDTGAVEAFDADKLEEVLPYTIAITPLDRKHFEDDLHVTTKKDVKGTIAVGDLIIPSNGKLHNTLCTVVAVDTKCRTPQTIGGSVLKAAVTF